MGLTLQPISYPEACQFIVDHHSHHLPPQGWKFGIGVNDGEEVVGVVTVGRPVARGFDDGWTLEITRCCVNGHKNAASKLYGAARNASKALGYKRIVTYTLASEHGTSLKASGYKTIWQTSGGSWNCKARPRVDKAPTCQKVLWEG